MAGDQGEAEEAGAPLSNLQRRGQRLALSLCSLPTRGLVPYQPTQDARVLAQRPPFPLALAGIGTEGLSESQLVIRDESVAQLHSVTRSRPSHPMKLVLSLCPLYR